MSKAISEKKLKIIVTELDNSITQNYETWNPNDFKDTIEKVLRKHFIVKA